MQRVLRSIRVCLPGIHVAIISALFLCLFLPFSAAQGGVAPPILWTINVKNAGTNFGQTYVEKVIDTGPVTGGQWNTSIDLAYGLISGHQMINLNLQNDILTIDYDILHNIAASPFDNYANRGVSAVAVTVWAPLGNRMHVSASSTASYNLVDFRNGISHIPSSVTFPICDFTGTASYFGYGTQTLWYNGVEYGQLFDVWNNACTYYTTESLMNVFGGVRAESHGLAGRITVSAQNLQPQISVQPSTLDFGLIKAGEVRQQRLRVSNVGPTGSSLQVSLDSLNQPFRIVSGGGNFTLAGGASRLVTVEYKPTTYGVYEQLLQVAHNASNNPSPLTVPIKGRAKAKIKVWLNAFIPKDIAGLTVPAPSNFPDQTLIPLVPILIDYTLFGFMTDQRSFSNNPGASYRSHNEIVLETDGNIVAVNSTSHLAGVTTLVDRILGTSVSLTGSIDASFLGVNTENGIFTARLISSAQPGLYAWANLYEVPAIDVIGKMTINFNTRTASFSGLTDSFPAYEMYLSYNDGPGIAICQKQPEPGSNPQFGLSWPTIGDPYPLNGSTSF
jgi:hypothetical protein